LTETVTPTASQCPIDEAFTRTAEYSNVVYDIRKVILI
jgi:hypothetical protein